MPFQNLPRRLHRLRTIRSHRHMSPIVQQQIRTPPSLPIPRDRKTRESLARAAREIIEQRAKYREEAKLLPLTLQGKIPAEIAEEVEELVGEGLPE